MSLQRVLVVTVFSACVAVVGCAHDTAAVAAVSVAEPVPGAAPVIITVVDAPGYNVEDLTAHVRDAFARTSGVPVVDQFAVKAELAACTEAPCVTTQRDRFTTANTMVSTTISKVGRSVLGTVRVQRGLEELLRFNTQGSDAARVVDELGEKAGVAWHAIVTQPVPTTTTVPDNER